MVIKNMSFSLFGIKCGMTGYFESNGTFIPVTAIKVLKNYVIDIKTVSRDGYYAVKIASISTKKKKNF